jgi:hypothetical protein
MFGTRLEDCTKWLARGLSIAPNGSEWPQNKKATIKWQLRGLRQPTEKIAVRQWTCHAGLLRNCGTAI